MPKMSDLPMVLPQDCRELKAAIGQRTVILASSSPRRKEILGICGIPVKIVRPTVIEPAPEADDYRSWARRWALRKALSVVGKAEGKLIIGADTIVVLKGRAMGKPIDAADARGMLNRLSGRTHQVITGVAVIDGRSGMQATGSAVSNVTFRRLTKRDLESYLKTGEPWDKAGAYALQGHAGRFVEHVAGPVDNVVGLPVHRLAQLIRRVTHR